MIPEDMSLVINTAQGLVVVSGCGHSGIINTLEYARSTVRNAPIHAAIGGFHLYQLDDEKLHWTAAKLQGVWARDFPRRALHGHRSGVSHPRVDRSGSADDVRWGLWARYTI